MRAYEEALSAIKAGDVGRLNQLLDADSNLADLRDSEGKSLLFQALYHGQRTLAEAIAKKKSSVDGLELAALGHTEELLEAVSENESILTARSPDGFTALHYACYFGSDPCVKMLLEQGADPNAVSENAMRVTPLHSAVSSGRRHAVNMLILAGADVNRRQQSNFTALQGAAARGDLDVIQALINAGADPFARSDSGETALEIARRAGNVDAANRIEAAMKKLQRAADER